MFLRGETIAKEMPRWRGTHIFSKTGVSLFCKFLQEKTCPYLVRKKVLTKEVNSTIITLKVKIVEKRC